MDQSADGLEKQLNDIANQINSGELSRVEVFSKRADELAVMLKLYQELSEKLENSTDENSAIDSSLIADFKDKLSDKKTAQKITKALLITNFGSLEELLSEWGEPKIAAIIEMLAELDNDTDKPEKTIKWFFENYVEYDDENEVSYANFLKSLYREINFENYGYRVETSEEGIILNIQYTKNLAES